MLAASVSTPVATVYDTTKTGRKTSVKTEKETIDTPTSAEIPDETNIFDNEDKENTTE